MSLLAEATKRLHSHGGRLTPQRSLILQILEATPGHPTAVEIYLQVKQHLPNVHLSTIYRTLRWLQEEGLVNPRVFAEPTRQERFDANHPSEHSHFFCQSCGEVVEFVEPALKDQITSNFEAHTGAQVKQASLVLYGTCAKCQKG
jgi:Fe2+ or Zn2+ uptake regulation protein